MIHIRARLDAGTTWVDAEGATLAHAVRVAVRKLGLGAGRTLSKERVAPSAYVWNWSGSRLRVEVLPDRTALGNAHRERKMVTLTLSDEARSALETLSPTYGNKSAAAEAAILALAAKPRKTGA